MKSEGGGGCLFKGCLFDILAKGGGGGLAWRKVLIRVWA